ncbi:SHOCT domain-containing protein [bacterium]|nr:SHOCT domain-containing protein [bacterium]
MKALGIIFIILSIIFVFVGLSKKRDSEWWKNMSSEVSSHYRGAALCNADRNSTNMGIMFGIAGVLFVAGIIMVASGGKPAPVAAAAPVAPVAPESASKVEERLVQLSKLKSKGLLSEEEYAARRNELLDSLTKGKNG